MKSDLLASQQKVEDLEAEVADLKNGDRVQVTTWELRAKDA